MESKIEINSPLELNDLQRQKVLLHSFYNILTVVRLELYMLKSSCESAKAFSQSEQVFKNLREIIRKPHKNPQDILTIEFFCDDFRKVFAEDLKNCGLVTHDSANQFEDSKHSLTRILAIVEMRVKEFIQACKLDNDWISIPVDELKTKIEEVFTAMADHSHGRFKVCFDESGMAEDTYFINIEIKSPDDQTISIPAFLHDVTRDLTANARKYSKPGTRIDTILENTGNEVLLTVRDQGRGIPEAEIELVVEMGYRASNTTPEETNGEGFGLTKAYMICKKHNGRMWITSEPDNGTEIMIAIPVL